MIRKISPVYLSVIVFEALAIIQFNLLSPLNFWKKSAANAKIFYKIRQIQEAPYRNPPNKWYLNCFLNKKKLYLSKKDFDIILDYWKNPIWPDPTWLVRSILMTRPDVNIYGCQWPDPSHSGQLNEKKAFFQSFWNGYFFQL